MNGIVPTITAYLISANSVFFRIVSGGWADSSQTSAYDRLVGIGEVTGDRAGIVVAVNSPRVRRANEALNVAEAKTRKLECTVCSSNNAFAEQSIADKVPRLYPNLLSLH